LRRSRRRIFNHDNCDKLSSPTAARISHAPSFALDSHFSREFWSPVFADDAIVNNETVAISPLPHNPAFHPRRLVFATAAARAEFTEATIVRRKCADRASLP